MGEYAPVTNCNQRKIRRNTCYRQDLFRGICLLSRKTRGKEATVKQARRCGIGMVRQV